MLRKRNQENMEMQSSQIPAFLPCNFNTTSAVPKKLVSSFVALVRPLHSPLSPPWMVLSVEPSIGVTQLFNPFTRTPVQNFDLTKFRVTRLATECHIVDDDHGYGLFCSGSSFYVKALMFFQPSVPSIQNCRLFATFDDGQVRESHPFDRRHTYFENAFHDSHFYVDDIINYKDKICALEKRELLFLRRKRDRNCYCKKEFHFCTTDLNLKSEYGRIRRRKRLVVSSSGETLYMVDPITGHSKRPSGAIALYFRVSELDNASNTWRRVSSFEDFDVDQVLFVTRDYCFFVAASEFPGCQLRNCIVFSDDAFPPYSDSKCCWDYATKCGNEVAIFSLDKDDEYSLPVESFPGFPVMLWSPPPSIMQNASSPSQSKSQSEAEEDGMAQSASDSKDGASLQEDVLSTVVRDIKHVTEKALETKNFEGAIVQTNSMVRLAQPSVKEVKFRGIDVLPDHLPILENVWIKHGDVLEGSAICSSDTKSMALASLAKILLILETNNGNILANDQAQYVGSTFSDLQYMHLKLDWLAPSVEKALAIYKREQLMELEKAKAKTEEAERKFLSEMANMKQRLDKDIRLLSRSVPESGQVDQENGDRLHFLGRVSAAIRKLTTKGNRHR